MKRRSFSGELKAKVAIEAISGLPALLDIVWNRPARHGGRTNIDAQVRHWYR